MAFHGAHLNGFALLAPLFPWTCLRVFHAECELAIWFQVGSDGLENEDLIGVGCEGLKSISGDNDAVELLIEMDGSGICLQPCDRIRALDSLCYFLRIAVNTNDVYALP